MKDKFLYLLEELYDNYQEETFNQLKECYENELIIEELFQENERTIKAVNFAPKEFYEFLANHFVYDLNNFPEMYFLSYEMFFSFFEEDNLSKFFNIALNLSNGDATDYINGLIKLREESPEIALFHFNRIEDYFADYFISICYQQMENFENAIKTINRFLNAFEEQSKIEITDSDGVQTALGEGNGMKYAKWRTLNDLAYCYNSIQEYKKSLETINKSLSLYDLNSVYDIDYDPNLEEGEFDDFLIFANNYLLALEKNQNLEKSLEVLDFVISKYPNIDYYRKRKNILHEKMDKSSFADEIISKLFKPKKPFNLGKFEETKLLSKEKALEDMIMEQIKYGFKVFDKSLEVYNDNNIFGRQYYIASVNGFLDLLLIDPKTNIVYVVELKRNEAGIEVVEQTENYMQGLKKEIDNEIKGIICLHKPKKELTELVNQKDNIELYTYNFEFNKVE